MIAKRFLGILMSCLLVLAFLPVTAQADSASCDFTVSGDTGYAYDSTTHILTINRSGTYTLSMNGVAKTTRDTIVVNASNGPVNLTLNSVQIDVSNTYLYYGCAFDIQGISTVKLTLNGASTLKSGESKAGLQVPYGTAITIGGSGSLETFSDEGAGIGGGNNGAGGSITINDGTITTTVTGGGAGIGGGRNGAGGNITINGGTVTANGGGAGIGGGRGSDGGLITINGGTVTAVGGSYGAGIGTGGYYKYGSASLVITDGTVIATGGDYGAGIGGGYSEDSGWFRISGGTIVATGGYQAAGIGGGYDGSLGVCEISGGTIYATGGEAASGIGGGYGGSCDTVTISCGTVIAAGGYRAAGIGGASNVGGRVFIAGGTVSATGGYAGAGIGSGYNSQGGSTYISGGNVFAQGGEDAQDIGHGAGGTDNGELKNVVNGVNVYKTIVTLQDLSGATAVTALATSAGYSYGTVGMETDTFGRLYLYLPENERITEAQTSSDTYAGLINTLNTGTASGTLKIARTVTFMSDGNPYATKTVPIDTSIGSEDWPTNPEKTGHTFCGWFTGANGSGMQFKPDMQVTGNMTVYAYWILNSYAVKFNLGGSDVTNPNSISTYTYGSGAVALSAPSRAGYSFGGWYRSEAFSGSAVTSIDDALAATYANGSTITLYAKWKLAIPATPAGVKATTASYNSIRVDWSAVSGASGYEVWHSTSSGSGFMLVASAVAGTSYTNSSVATGTMYYYKIRAYCTVNGTKVYGPYSAVVSTRTVPATPASPKATAASYSSIKVTWSAAGGAGGYEVWRSTNSGSGFMLVASAVAGTSYTNSSVATGTMYYYKIRAYCAVSGPRVYGPYSAVVSARTVPATPASTKAAAASYNSIKVSWSAAGGAGGYEVWRSTSSGSGFMLVASAVAGTSYTNSSVATGTTYYYKIRAYCSVGGTRVYGPYSAVASTRTVPAVPTSPKATAASFNSVKLTWSAAAGAGGYEVWRSTTAASGYTLAVTTTATSYTSTGLSTGTTYYYKIRAYRTVNGSRVYGGYSPVVFARTVPATPAGAKATAVSYNSARVTWSAAGGAGGYEVWRSTTAASGYKLAATVIGTSSTSTGLATGTTYYYKIRAYRTVNGVKVYGLYSAVVSAKPVLSTATSLKAARVSATSIKLTWGTVAGVTRYEVYRATSGTGTYTRLTEVISATYTNTGLTTGKTYYYKVRAYRLVGGVKVYGGYSAVVSAKP